jgi:tetratricopeptide (TPR) repeat protein
MKKFLLLSVLLIGGLGLFAQIHYNPQVSIKPIAAMSVYKVEVTPEATKVTIRLRNQSQLAPFSIPTMNLIIRKTSEAEAYKLISADNAPFYPKRHTFSFKDEVLEFTLVFPPIPPPIKYLDITEADKEGADKRFYLQGIILDEDMNREITRGFRAYSSQDFPQALEAFKNVAEMDPYYEFGMAHFNVIYLLANQKNWKEAGEWYKKFQDRFFYDKTLLDNELAKMGIIPRLEAGR